MEDKKKRTKPIPEEFASYAEAAEFWDTHDTMDYPQAFRSIKTETKFRHRHYEVEIAADVVKTLRTQARQKGVTVSHLASALLRQQLTAYEN